MQLRYVLRINYAMRKPDDRAYPYDLTEKALENVTHYSENEGKDIPILDMDILHVVRAFVKKENTLIPLKNPSKLRELIKALDLELKT